MDGVGAVLSQYPIKTRVAITGLMVVAQAIAHAKIADQRPLAPMPGYLQESLCLLCRPRQDARG